jgi:CheY-like chemotaxis protein
VTQAWSRLAVDADFKLRVLVVDDCRDTTESLAILLRSWGHEPAVAHSGADGLRACAAACPDVVILDVAMPRMTGWEVAARLRRDPATAAVYIIAVSGYGQAEDHERSRAAGCDLHLLKPIDPDALAAILRTRRHVLATRPAEAVLANDASL